MNASSNAWENIRLLRAHNNRVIETHEVALKASGFNISEFFRAASGVKSVAAGSA